MSVETFTNYPDSQFSYEVYPAQSEQAPVISPLETPVVKELGDTLLTMLLGNVVLGGLVQVSPNGFSTPLAAANPEAYAHTLQAIAVTNSLPNSRVSYTNR